MDKDRIEGKLEDLKGRLKRQVEEWTGDQDAQAEGTAEQVKGKIRSTWGQMKDAGREALNREQATEEEASRKKDEDAA
jgi:uncharacterized protein YjbJ (UPF0337 family)